MSSEEQVPRDETGSAPAAGNEAGHGPDDGDVHGNEDATLGGYFRTHDRPPGFEGVDGHPYTVSIEVEKSPDLRAPYGAWLVFPRWATTGLGIVGHVESPLLWRAASRDDAVRDAGRTSLLRVQQILNEAIQQREADT